MGKNLPDEHFQSKWRKIVNIMQYSSLRVSRITPTGSRAKRTHRPDSDMDIIFAVSNNPTRQQFYPRLIHILESNFPKDKVYPGKDFNIIHIDFRSGARFELILLTEQEFDAEYRSIKIYRKRNL